MVVPFEVMKTSLIGLPFLGTLVGVTAVAVGCAWRRRRPSVLVRVASGLLIAVMVGALVNDYFAYLPDVGALVGRRAFDQASPGDLARRLALTRTAAESPVPIRTVGEATRGVVLRVHIPAARSGFRARPAQVYLPPAYFRSDRPRLPVIELLHGTPGAPEDWTRAGWADLAADRLAQHNAGMAPIIVMPDPNGSWWADTECVDGHAGRAETYLTDDVPTWVVATFGADGDRRAWAVAGSSAGGYCALMLGLRHRDRYSTIVDMAGLDRPTFDGGVRHLFNGDRVAQAAHDPRVLLAARAPGPPLSAWFEVGSADGAVTSAVRSIAASAAADGIDVHLEIVPDAHHTWRLFRRGFEASLPWTAAHIGLPIASTIETRQRNSAPTAASNKHRRSGPTHSHRRR